MADNVPITAGSGTVIAADEVTDATLGVVKVQFVKLMDGTLDGTAKAAVSAAGLAVSSSGQGASVAVTPTVTAGSYTAGYVMGGIMTFANVLPASFHGTLNSITLKFKGSVQTTEFDVAIFKASPAGTFSDHGAPAIASADTAQLLGIYQMTNYNSQLGTHTIYNNDRLQKEIDASATSLYAVVTTASVPVNPASSSDMTLELGVTW